MNSKIIAGTCILSLAFTLCACGPMNETYEQVEFTETTTAETATSTITALAGSLTAITGKVSTVTTLNTTGALTSVTGSSTAVGAVQTETEAEKQQDNVQDSMQDVVAEQPPEIEIKVEDTKYNDSNSETPTTQVVTTTTTETTDIATAVTAVETTTAETTAKIEDDQPYLVYKPSTKYAHKSTCRWNKDDAYRCDDFSDLETRICTECNPNVGYHIEYQAPTVDSSNKTYLGNFYMTYYPATAYYDGVCGGSGRTLRGYGDYNDGIRGSVACRTIQESYGYDRNGRTTVYLEFPSYPCMNGDYWVDDCCGAYGTIDVFVWSSSACPFGYDGVTWADCWIY